MVSYPAGLFDKENVDISTLTVKAFCCQVKQKNAMAFYNCHYHQTTDGLPICTGLKSYLNSQPMKLST